MPPKAKPGEGIALILDVSPHVRAGVNETFFSLSKKCLINILQRKMFAEKCKDEIAVILFGSDETDNSLATDNQYQNIKVLQEPSLVSWDLINKVERITGGKQSGDWLDTLVVAMDLLHDPEEVRFSGKKIVLFTDFSSEFSDDQTSTIIKGLCNQGISLNIIGPEILEENADDSGNDIDAPGPSNGMQPFKNGVRSVPQNWNGKPKTAVQLAGEAVATRIVAEADGGMYSFEDAIPQLIFFEKRSAASGNWNTLLDIGPSFQIAITGRIKIKHATVPSWKTAYASDESAVIIKETSYHRNDDAQTPVDESDVIPGYRYGTTLVPYLDEDMQLKYFSNSPRSLSILGFTRRSNVSYHLRAGDQVLVITGREGDETAAVALSAFIHALEVLDFVGITRRVYNKNYDPVLGVLFPEITKEYECLIWIPLPFQEDVRSYTFPSLSKTIEKLSDSEKQAMDDLITAMDLTEENENDDGATESLLEPSVVLNPQLQHYCNALTHRAVHEHDPLPAPADHVISVLKPPEEVIEGRDACSKKLASLFPTKKIVKKSKRDNKDLFASNEEESNKKLKLDDADDTLTSSDLTRVLVTKITTANPVEDFYGLLKGEAPNFSLICSQMRDIILQLVESWSPGASSEVVLSRVIDSLTAFRKESCLIDPSLYNDLMSQLKDVVISRSIQPLWDRVKEGNLGLVTTEESLKSSVSSTSAIAFLELEAEAPQELPEPKQEDDEVEDLLDDL
ncbi:X-ray repair cross-complementing protein 5 [Palaemon carinicauda]|uniref:X-ray repair cross-complementing protein 5 n=1 Tax=Palaemon carinicauda TaxID=392227 RepID=UPI0035B635DA